MGIEFDIDPQKHASVMFIPSGALSESAKTCQKVCANGKCAKRNAKT